MPRTQNQEHVLEKGQKVLFKIKYILKLGCPLKRRNGERGYYIHIHTYRKVLEPRIRRMKHDKDHNRMLARNMKYPRGRRSMIAYSGKTVQQL